MFALLYAFHDGSGSGLVYASDRREMLEWLLKVLTDHGDMNKRFWIEESTVCP